MKYNHFFSMLLFSLLIVISSCSPDQDCHGISPDYKFNIIDKETEIDQVNYGRKYNPDSIRLEVNGINIISRYTKFEHDFFQGRNLMKLRSQLTI